MKEIWESATDTAVKRSLIIVFIFILAIFSATLWPKTDSGDNILPVIDGVIDEFEYPVFHRIGEIGLFMDNDEEYGYFALTSPGLGWVAIGFSPFDFHLGANFLFFPIVDGEMVVSDQYGVSQFAHESDIILGGSSDIVEYNGVEESSTVVEFRFRLNSGDIYDIALEEGGTYSIIVAYSEADDIQVKHTKMYHHVISILRRSIQ